MQTPDHAANRDWLGLPSLFTQPISRAAVPMARASAPLGVLLNSRGDAAATEPTDVWLWYDTEVLHLRARCHTTAMDRVRRLADRPVPYARDAWGDDALEVQIDVGRTRGSHRHFILPPNGMPITFLGFNNRQVHGWHPRFDFRVILEESAWVVEAAFAFSVLERSPAEGEVWGLNVMRVNPSEPGQYVQWAPTFGDALRPELLGEIEFSGKDPGDRAADIAAYARRAAARKSYFLSAINGVRDDDALRALGIADWTIWGERLARRMAPLPLRWEDFTPGHEGILEAERPWLLDSANALVDQIAGWSDSPPEPPNPAALAIEALEALGDAYLLTGDRRFVDAFERAIQLHIRLVDQIAATVSDPHQLPYAVNPYHDSQIIRVEMLSYVYLTMRRATLSPRTHAAMMRTILRGCRFAAFNISDCYCYGNHQVYESGGLAAVAALFPEFDESDSWASVAGRSIRRHLEREVYPDGGYLERCGYHSVAMGYTMHAVATIRANAIENRFPDLMQPATLRTLEHMHDWLLAMLCPDGTMPAFGDVGASTHLRFLSRGTAVFRRSDLAWPLHQLTPALIPPGLEPREPSTPASVSLDSQFTVMRDGRNTTDFYMAVDHGPLGGQHSHVDTLGFVAYAHGEPVALDSGMGRSYEDPRYVGWFRSLRAHNVIAIDEVETEKIAERLFWKPGTEVDVLGLRSRAYEHTLGIIHDRTLFFVKGLGWLIHDRLHAPAGADLSRHRIEWLLHTPRELKEEEPGVLHGASGGGGLLVIAAFPETLEAPRLERTHAAVPLREVRSMRLWDIGRIGPRISAEDMTPQITSLAWPWKPVRGNSCEFAAFLLPYRGERPEARLIADSDGITLRRAGRPDIHVHRDGKVVFQEQPDGV
ncbi:MAG: heparinase II/III family protein [Planctomycetes bacterium]|nr:heparinase II/III family protein [Planctomycetota bacterium]